MVGQGGQLFVRGTEDGGSPLVRCGDDGRTQQCKVSYQSPAREKGAAGSVIDSVSATCQ